MIEIHPRKYRKIPSAFVVHARWCDVKTSLFWKEEDLNAPN